MITCGDCWYYWWKPEVQLLPIPPAPCCTTRLRDAPVCAHFEPIDQGEKGGRHV